MKFRCCRLEGSPIWQSHWDRTWSVRANERMRIATTTTMFPSMEISVRATSEERTLVQSAAHDDVVEGRYRVVPGQTEPNQPKDRSTNGGHLYVVRIGLDSTVRRTRDPSMRFARVIDSFSYVFNSYDDANVVFVRSVPQVWKLREHRLSERQVFSVHTDGKSGYSTDWRLLNGDSIEAAPVEEFVDQDFEVIAGLYADFFGGGFRRGGKQRQYCFE